MRIYLNPNHICYHRVTKKDFSELEFEEIQDDLLTLLNNTIVSDDASGKSTLLCLTGNNLRLFLEKNYEEFISNLPQRAFENYFLIGSSIYEFKLVDAFNFFLEKARRYDTILWKWATLINHHETNFDDVLDFILKINLKREDLCTGFNPRKGYCARDNIFIFREVISPILEIETEKRLSFISEVKIYESDLPIIKFFTGEKIPPQKRLLIERALLRNEYYAEVKRSLFTAEHNAIKRSLVFFDIDKVLVEIERFYGRKGVDIFKEKIHTSHENYVHFVFRIISGKK